MNLEGRQLPEAREGKEMDFPQSLQEEPSLTNSLNLELLTSRTIKIVICSVLRNYLVVIC